MAKKVFNVIFFVLSIIFAVCTVVVAAFCIYDIKSLSSGAWANSFDMWYALRTYPRLLLNLSAYGLISNVLYIILSEKGDKKIFKVVSLIFFVVIIVAAFVLRYFCYRDF